MELLEFCKGIELMDEAVERILSLQLTEDEYMKKWEMCRNDYEAFSNDIKEKENFRGLALAYLCRFACEVYPLYKEQEIEEQIFWDTFSDIRCWCENCHREFGEYGINEIGWFWRHLKLTLFKLGRLQFELLDTKRPIKGTVAGKEYDIPTGTPVISVHIQQGEPLLWEACEQSFAQAFQWFGKEIPYICHSWLLYPGLKELMRADSNIIQFQNHFVVVASDYEWPDAERRIFGKVMENPAEYPEDSRLRKAAKQYLLAGNQLGNAVGIYLPPE